MSTDLPPRRRSVPPDAPLPRRASGPVPADAQAQAKAKAKSKTGGAAGGSAFVPSAAAKERRSRRGRWMALALLAIAAVVAVAVMVNRPRLAPRPLDAVERVASDYLAALVRQDDQAAQKLSTLEDHPGIRSARGAKRQKDRDHRINGPFAPLAALHKKINKDFNYDKTAGRFVPKNSLGLAAETLDSLHEAKDQAKASGLYDKMASGDPDDVFDSAEQLGKVMEDISKKLEPRRLVPTYKMLVESARPPLPAPAKELALDVAEAPEQWQGLLHRSFWSLRADGPFVHEQAEVTATVTDRLASHGDPPSRLRLRLARFQLEGIDTGWKVVSAERIAPGEEKPKPRPYEKPAASAPSTPEGPGPRPYDRAAESSKE